MNGFMNGFMNFRSVKCSLMCSLASTLVSSSALSAKDVLTLQVPMVSEADARKFCLEEWFPRLRLGRTGSSDAEVKKSVAHLLELYSDDIEIVDPNAQDMVKSDSLKGKAQVTSYYEAILKTYPVWTLKILDIYPTAKGFVLRYEGRDAGPVARFEGVDILELKRMAGKWRIVKILEYYDRLPFVEPASAPAPKAPESK